MSTRVNSAAIGAFVVGAIVLLLVALLVWGGTGLFRSKLTYVLFFDSAVTGLNKGAPVLARGVKIGEVTDVQLRWGTRGVIGVYVGLEPDLLKGMAEGGPAQALERAVQQDGLRAQLRLESFVTGVLYVALGPAARYADRPARSRPQGAGAADHPDRNRVVDGEARALRREDRKDPARSHRPVGGGGPRRGQEHGGLQGSAGPAQERRRRDRRCSNPRRARRRPDRSADRRTTIHYFRDRQE